MSLELARTPGQIADLFWNGDRACADRLAAALVKAQWLDALAFIPAYAAFLALGARALRDSAPRIALAAMVAVLAAALFDEIEGVILFDVIKNWESPGFLGELFWAVHAKFALLGLGEVLLALLLVRTGWIGRIAAIPLAGGGLVSLWLLFTAPRDPWMMKAHFYAWSALLLVALVAAIRPALVRRAQAD